MRTKPLLSLFTLLLFEATTPSAEAQGLTPAEKKKVTVMIADLDRILLGGSEKNNQRALAACQAALKNSKATYEFFMESTKELDFEQAGKREADWREWKERNEDRYKSAEHIAARQYQLRFLVLTVKVLMSKDEPAAMKQAIPDMLSYYDLMAENFDQIEGHEHILSRPVLESLFARRLKLDVSVKTKSNTWPDSALPVSQAYEQLILPHFRGAKDHRALQTAWDRRIRQEGKTIGAGRNEAPGIGGGGRRWIRDDREREREERREDSRQKQVSEGEFKAVRLPELQWGKARDSLQFGPSRSAAFSALGQVLRDNLAHPDARSWLAELKTLANSK